MTAFLSGFSARAGTAITRPSEKTCFHWIREASPAKHRTKKMDRYFRGVSVSSDD